MQDLVKQDTLHFNFFKDLRALTLVGPPKNNPEADPLAVLHPNNRLYIFLNKREVLFENC